MSIKVMVVEDEPPILRAISRMIEQCDSEFIVTHAAKNGAEAIECLKVELVDVMFTDIRMPVLDGLALMDYVHSNFPDIFIVVLSGYHDFEYAKRALLHRAFDYLLKPLSRADLSELLFRLKTSYQLKRNHQKSMMLSSNINKSLKSPITESIMGEQYLMVLMCAGPPTFMMEDITLPGADFWNAVDWPSIYARTAAGVNDTNEKKLWIFEGETLTERIVIIELDEETELEQHATQLYTMINMDKNMPITAVFYSIPAQFSEMSSILRTLKQQLVNNQRFGYSLLIPVDEKPDTSKTEAFPSFHKDKLVTAAENNLLNSLLTGEQEAIEAGLTECLKVFDSAQSSHAQIFWTIENMLTKYWDSRNESQRSSEIQLMVYEAVYHSLTYESLFSNLMSLFDTLVSQPEVEKRTKTQELVEKMKKYLNESYNQPITSESLSKKFGFVPSYISRIFRQQTGYAPNEYITLLRMKSAKEIMRNQPELMIKEVAFLVGYKNQYHFSKTFKKEEGVWPSDFKRENMRS